MRVFQYCLFLEVDILIQFVASRSDFLRGPPVDDEPDVFMEALSITYRSNSIQQLPSRQDEYVPTLRKLPQSESPGSSPSFHDQRITNNNSIDAISFSSQYGVPLAGR